MANSLPPYDTATAASIDEERWEVLWDRQIYYFQYGSILCMIVHTIGVPCFYTNVLSCVLYYLNRYYSTFIANMSNKYKEVYAATAEIVGMLLSLMEKTNHVRPHL